MPGLFFGLRGFGVYDAVVARGAQPNDDDLNGLGEPVLDADVVGTPEVDCVDKAPAASEGCEQRISLESLDGDTVEHSLHHKAESIACVGAPVCPLMLEATTTADRSCGSMCSSSSTPSGSSREEAQREHGKEEKETQEPSRASSLGQGAVDRVLPGQGAGEEQAVEPFEFEGAAPNATDSDLDEGEQDTFFEHKLHGHITVQRAPEFVNKALFDDAPSLPAPTKDGVQVKATGVLNDLLDMNQLAQIARPTCGPDLPSLKHEEYAVELLLYDVSAGASNRFSDLLLGRHLEAIYHTGVVVFGREFWYGGSIYTSRPGAEQALFGPFVTESSLPLSPSSYDNRLKVVHLGYTSVTQQQWYAFLVHDMKRRYTAQNYDVLENNCNHFANDCAFFLTGKGIPEEITLAPQVFNNSRTFATLRPYLNLSLGGVEQQREAEASENTARSYQCEDHGRAYCIPRCELLPNAPAEGQAAGGAFGIQFQGGDPKQCEKSSATRSSGVPRVQSILQFRSGQFAARDSKGNSGDGCVTAQSVGGFLKTLMPSGVLCMCGEDAEDEGCIETEIFPVSDALAEQTQAQRFDV